MMDRTSIASAIAFNKGSDARLRGEPVTACPYSWDESQSTAWRAGFLSVDKHWGIDARWPVKPLVPVGCINEASA